jgi:hypothetical protein
MELMHRQGIENCMSFNNFYSIGHNIHRNNPSCKYEVQLNFKKVKNT